MATALPNALAALAGVQPGEGTWIGSRQVFDTRSFIVSANEQVTLTIDVYGWKPRLSLIFEPGAKEHGLRIEPDGSGGAKIIFAQWNNPLGTATVAPTQVGTLSNGMKVYFTAVHWMFGPDALKGTQKLDIQFLVGF